MRERTGLVLDPYFSATKIEWLLEHVDGLRERAAAGPRRASARSTPGSSSSSPASTSTDPTNASRTMLYDIRRATGTTSCSSSSACPSAALPASPPERRRVRRDRATARSHGHDGVPVAGIAGDQQAALFGQALPRPRARQEHVRDRLVRPAQRGRRAAAAPPGLLATVAWGIGERLAYALEAAIFVDRRGGPVAARRARDHRGRRRDRGARRVAGLATTASTSSPRSPASARPHWDPYARGTIVGLTRGSERARTSPARRSRRSPTRPSTPCGRWRPPPGEPLAELRADGGATVNAWLMQFQADVLGVPVVRPRDRRDDGARRRAARRGRRRLLTVEAASRAAGASGARYEPRMSEDERETLLARLGGGGRARGRLGREAKTGLSRG